MWQYYNEQENQYSGQTFSSVFPFTLVKQQQRLKFSDKQTPGKQAGGLEREHKLRLKVPVTSRSDWPLVSLQHET